MGIVGTSIFSGFVPQGRELIQAGVQAWPDLNVQ